MNPVPRPMVYTAALALAGACVLGLYLGIQPSLNRPGEAEEALVPASATPSMKPGMAAAVEATPLKTETPPPSSAPALLAQAAKPKTKASDADTAPDSDADAGNGAQAGRKSPPPEPPTLYSPDEAPAPTPVAGGGANTPPY